MNLLQNKDNIAAAAAMAAMTSQAAAMTSASLAASGSNSESKKVGGLNIKQPQHPGATNYLKSESPTSASNAAPKHLLNKSDSTLHNRSQLSKSASLTSKGSNSLMPPPPTSKTNKLQPGVPGSSPALTAGASGTIPSLSTSPTNLDKSSSNTSGRHMLINPNTGVLESGPSESSSESEAESSSGLESSSSVTSNTQSIQPRGSGDTKALKLKLKLPTTPPNNQATSSSTSSSGTPAGTPGASNSDKNGPKLPKLILSMRDKTVKLSSLNKKRALEEDSHDAPEDMDTSDAHRDANNTSEVSRLKIKSPKRTLESDVKSELKFNHVDSNKSTKSGGTKLATKVAVMPLNNSVEKRPAASGPKSGSIPVTSAGLNPSGSTSNSRSATTASGVKNKLHNNDNRLSNWANNINSRLEKGAFSGRSLADHDEDFSQLNNKGKYVISSLFRMLLWKILIICANCYV